MKVFLKAPFCLGGADLKKGHHELPDSLWEDWFLRGLLKEGKIQLVEAPKLPEEAPAQEEPKHVVHVVEARKEELENLEKEEPKKPRGRKKKQKIEE
jgi:hypothetical protein